MAVTDEIDDTHHMTDFFSFFPKIFFIFFWSLLLFAHVKRFRVFRISRKLVLWSKLDPHKGACCKLLSVPQEKREKF